VLAHQPRDTDDPRVGALLSLPHALKAVDKVLDAASGGTTRQEMEANAKRIAEGNWASEAVRKAIDEVMAAVLSGRARRYRPLNFHGKEGVSGSSPEEGSAKGLQAGLFRSSR
jgi:hypothetical protein